MGVTSHAGSSPSRAGKGGHHGNRQRGLEDSGQHVSPLQTDVRLLHGTVPPGLASRAIPATVRTVRLMRSRDVLSEWGGDIWNNPGPDEGFREAAPGAAGDGRGEGRGSGG